MHEEFISFMSQYDALKSSRDVKERSSTLEYHDFDRDKHYFCSIKDMSDPQDQSNRLHYRYSVVVELLAVIQRDYPDLKAEAAAVLRASETMFTKGIKAIQSDIRKIQKLRSDASNFINSNVLQPMFELKNAITLAIEEGSNVVNFPIQTFNALASSLDIVLRDLGGSINTIFSSFANNIRNTQRTLYRLQTYPEIFAENIEDATENLARQFIHADGGSFAGTNVYNDSPSSYVQTSVTGASSYTISRGQTLPDIALETLGDVKRWKEIALLNSLSRSPYITEDGAKGTLKPGNQILIPDTSGFASEGTRNAVGDATENDVKFYGRDLLLTTDKNGLLDRIFNTRGMLETVKGESNVYQAVMLKQQIQRGTLKEDVTFGLSLGIGEGVSGGDSDYAVWSHRESLESDPRIRRAKVSLIQEGNETRFKTDIVLENSTGSDRGLVVKN